MTQPAFLASEFQPAAPAEAGYHVIPVPLERTTSYMQGTAAGPAAILGASQQLEASCDGRSPGVKGIHTTDAVPVDGSIETCICSIAEVVAAACKTGARPVVLGGEHTVTCGAVRGLQSSGAEFGVIQFDAHADLRNSYGQTRWSHACTACRILEYGIPILQIGVRSLSEEEAVFRAEHRVPCLDARELHTVGAGRLPSLLADFPNRVYITFDVDAFDASLMSATGTPEPGGLMWWQTIDLLEQCVDGKTVLGADVVELAPAPGFHHCDYTAAKLAYTLMGTMG